MSGTIGYEELRAATVRQVAQLMAAAAITAPKSGGQLFLAGKPGFMETAITDDPATLSRLATWMRARGKERRERIWFRDAGAAEAFDAILFVGLLPGWGVAVAARKLGIIQAHHAVALSRSMTHKAVGFDRPMPEADFDPGGKAAASAALP
jgi:uncharacterized ferredoxin-like protein